MTALSLAKTMYMTAAAVNQSVVGNVIVNVHCNKTYTTAVISIYRGDLTKDMHNS